MQQQQQQQRYQPYQPYQQQHQQHQQHHHQQQQQGGGQWAGYPPSPSPSQMPPPPSSFYSAPPPPPLHEKGRRQIHVPVVLVAPSPPPPSLADQEHDIKLACKIVWDRMQSSQEEWIKDTVINLSVNVLKSTLLSGLTFSGVKRQGKKCPGIRSLAIDSGYLRKGRQHKHTKGITPLDLIISDANLKESYELPLFVTLTDTGKEFIFSK
jgi:hypothetical protein